MSAPPQSGESSGRVGGSAVGPRLIITHRQRVRIDPFVDSPPSYCLVNRRPAPPTSEPGEPDIKVEGTRDLAQRAMLRPAEGETAQSRDYRRVVVSLPCVSDIR